MSANRAWEIASSIVNKGGFVKIRSAIDVLKGMDPSGRHDALVTLREGFATAERGESRDLIALAIFELSTDPEVEALSVLLCAKLTSLVHLGRERLESQPALKPDVVAHLRSEMCLDGVEKRSPGERTRLLQALTDLGTDAAPALERVIGWLDELIESEFEGCENTALPYALARAISEIGVGHEAAAEALHRLLAAPQVRQQAFKRVCRGHLLGGEVGAISGLGRLKDRASEVLLLNSLYDQREHLRNAAALALAELAPLTPSHIRQVRYALFDPHPGVVQAACIALGRCGAAARDEAYLPLLSLLHRVGVMVMETSDGPLRPNQGVSGMHAVLLSNLVWSLLEIEPVLVELFPKVAELRLSAPYLHLWDHQGQAAMADFVSSAYAGDGSSVAEVVLDFVREAAEL